MKVSIRKEISVKTEEYSLKYIIGLNQFKGYRDLITRSCEFTGDTTRYAGSLPLTWWALGQMLSALNSHLCFRVRSEEVPIMSKH